MASQLIPFGDAADMLSVSKDSVRRMIKLGLIKTVRILRRVLIPQSELERVISEGRPYPPKRAKKTGSKTPRLQDISEAKA